MRVFAFVALFLSAALASGQCPPGGTCQAPIRPDHVVQNLTGRQCAWVSLAALANRAGEPTLAATATAHPAAIMGVGEIADCCQAVGVKCEVNAGALTDFLTKHVTNGHRPCAIGVYGGSHVVLVTHFEAGKCVGTVGNLPGRGAPKLWAWDEFLTVLRPDGLAYCLPGDDGSKADKAAVIGTAVAPAGIPPPAFQPSIPPVVYPQSVYTQPVIPYVVHPPARAMPADCPPGQP